MISLVILGEAASKANSRRSVLIAGRPASIKSEKALGFEYSMLRQIPPLARQRLEGPVTISLTIYYRTQRPDLDESLVLDCLQDRYIGSGEKRQLVQSGVIKNDRQIREKHVYHRIDKNNPRVEIQISPMEGDD